MSEMLAVTNEAYCRTIIVCAEKAGLLLWHLKPDEYFSSHCFIFRIPAHGGFFRSGDRNKDARVALRSACDAIRGELAARGFDLPVCPT
jgi:hypothetical protein